MSEIDEHFHSGRKWVKHVPKEDVGDKGRMSRTIHERIMDRIRSQTPLCTKDSRPVELVSSCLSETEKFCADKLLEQIESISSLHARNRVIAICTDPDRINKNILPGLMNILQIHPGDVNVHNIVHYIKEQLKNPKK